MQIETMTTPITKTSLIVSMLSLNAVGGGENFTIQVAIAQSLSGSDCDLVYPLDNNLIFSENTNQKRFQIPFCKVTYSHGQKFDSRLLTFGEVLGLMIDYKTIFIHQYLATPLTYDLINNSHPSQKILYTNNGSEQNIYDFHLRYFSLPSHWFLEISQYSADRIEKRIPHHQKQIHYVYGGIWKNEIRGTRELSTIIENKRNDQYISVGRVLPHKSFEIAIDACHKNEQFIIVGPLQKNSDYQKYLNLRAKFKDVTFTGTINSSEKKKLISESFVLLVNSSEITYNQEVFEQSELLGLVILEAIINGTLPITSDQSALQEVMIELELGDLIYKQRNVKDLRKKIDQVKQLSSIEYQEKIQKSIALIQKKFLWDDYSQKVNAIIRT